MNSSYKSSVSSKLIDMQIFEDKSIATVTGEGGIKIIKDSVTKDYRIQNLTGQKPGSFRSFEKDGAMLFAFLTEGSKKLIIYDFANKNQVASFLSDFSILFLEVDYSGELVLFYTNDFKLNVFDVGSNKLLSSISIEKDFIPTKIVFNSDLNRVALICETGQGFVCSPVSLKLYGTFTTSGNEACFNGFLDEKHFVSISKDGHFMAVDTDTMKSSRYTLRFPSFCKRGFFVNDNRFFLAVFKDSGFGIFDIEEEKMVCSGKLDSAEPWTVRFDEVKMLLAVEDAKGFLSTYDVAALFVEFRVFFSQKDFVSCYRMVAENELLFLTDAPRMLEDVFSAFAMSALKMAENENYDGAIRQLSPFIKVSQKRTELKEIVESIETMRSFVGFIKARKFSNAYNLAERYRFLKLTTYYKSIEDEWRSVVEQAKTLSMSGKLDEAKECFAVFRGVGSKTDLIRQILAERETINLFLKKLAAKDFKSSFELANLHPFLKELKEYKILRELGEKAAVKAELMMKTGEIQKANDAISALRTIPLFAHEVEHLERKLVIYQKYFAHKKTGDQMKIKILEKKYPFLIEANSLPL